MSTLKHILTYLAWTAVSIVLSFASVRMLLGPVPDEETFGNFSFVAQLFYGYGLLYVGLVIGSIVALLFILMDIFHLKKRLKNKPRRTIIRLLIIVLIMIIVAIVHYVLEKVIDVI